MRIADTLFPEFDSHDFAAIEHRGYTRVLRELTTLQNRLYDCTKFEKLFRYRCANLFFLVLSTELFDETEVPVGWGVLVEDEGAAGPDPVIEPLERAEDTRRRRHGLGGRLPPWDQREIRQA